MQSEKKAIEVHHEGCQQIQIWNINRKNENVVIRKTSFKCKKKVHYYNEFSKELPVTTEKKGTSLLISLLINKEDSSDEEIDKQ